jgi:uncharacterized membrane protein
MPSPLTQAATLGASAGLRSFAPAAVLAARGKGPFPGPARFIAWGAAAGELIADKQPDMPSRWATRGLTLRIGFSALGGRELAGARGAAIGAGVALTTALVGSRLRSRLPRATAPRILSGAVEDAIAYTLAALATG